MDLKKPLLGIAGVGVMGLPMAIRLALSGHSVRVFDPDGQRQHLATNNNLELAADAPDLLRRAGVLLVVVLDFGQMQQLVKDWLQGDVDLHGKTVFLCSTIAPQDTMQISVQLLERGACVFDAPVSGGPARALSGALSIMVSGPRSEFAAHNHWLGDLFATQIWLGSEIGLAAKAKLVNNFLAGAHLAAAGQAFALVDRLGLDPEVMFKLIQASSGASWMLGDRVPRALAQDLDPRAQTHVLTKDLRLACRLAVEHGSDLSLGVEALRLLQATCDAGHRDDDDASLIALLRSLGSVSPPPQTPS